MDDEIGRIEEEKFGRTSSITHHTTREALRHAQAERRISARNPTLSATFKSKRNLPPQRERKIHPLRCSAPNAKRKEESSKL